MAVIVKSGTFDPKLEGLKLSPEVKAFLARKDPGAILYVDTDYGGYIPSHVRSVDREATPS